MVVRKMKYGNGMEMSLLIFLIKHQLFFPMNGDTYRRAIHRK
jgi:hypothetical protein